MKKEVKRRKKAEKMFKKVFGPLYQFNADAKMPRNGTFLTYDRGFYFVLDPPLSHGGTAPKVPGSSPVDPPKIFSKVMTYQFFIRSDDPPPKKKKFFFQKL